ncbi:Uncharacterised protein [Enterobacter asburiae]|uniref:Uncharacterized protein n=1 Tax=Enterobacter asburiae TaxID=61645 RepID=A0A376F4J6_ENTAS|nr:Uncharacterised protein [Enterobacter asburiae]
MRAGKITLFQIQRELGIAQKVEDILAIVVGPAQAQQLLRKAVTPEDCPFFGCQNNGIRQRLCTAAKTLNQASQLAATLFITHLHLMQTVQQRLPAAASRRRRHTSVNPQPPREAQQVPEMPDQQPGDRRQQKPRQVSKKGPRRKAGIQHKISSKTSLFHDRRSSHASHSCHCSETGRKTITRAADRLHHAIVAAQFQCFSQAANMYVNRPVFDIHVSFPRRYSATARGCTRVPGGS